MNHVAVVVDTSSWVFPFLMWPWTVAYSILWIHGCWTFISILRRWTWRCSLTQSRWPLCSADGCGSTDGDEWFISVNSSSASGVTIGWVCGTCGACAWGYVRSRDLDRPRDLSSCDGWSSSLIGFVISWGSGCEGLRGTRSRDVLLGPTISLSPAGDGAGGLPGGRPGEPGGSWGSGGAGGCGPCIIGWWNFWSNSTYSAGEIGSLIGKSSRTSSSSLIGIVRAWINTSTMKLCFQQDSVQPAPLPLSGGEMCRRTVLSTMSEQQGESQRKPRMTKDEENLNEDSFVWRSTRMEPETVQES